MANLGEFFPEECILEKIWTKELGKLDLTHASTLPEAHTDMQPEYSEQDGLDSNCYSSDSDQMGGEREGCGGLRHEHPLS